MVADRIEESGRKVVVALMQSNFAEATRPHHGSRCGGVAVVSAEAAALHLLTFPGRPLSPVFLAEPPVPRVVEQEGE